MLDMMTDNARRAITLAQEESRMLYHSYIGAEHVLLGLIHESGGVAGQALAASGLSFERLEEIREAVSAPRGPRAVPGYIPFTPRARKSFEYAMRLSVKLGQHHVGSGHLLIGLLEENRRRSEFMDTNEAVALLRHFEVDLDALKKRLLDALKADPELETTRHHQPGFAPEPPAVRGPNVTITTTAEEFSVILDWFNNGQPTRPARPDEVAIMRAWNYQLQLEN